jgi:hypothetical protein
MCSQGIRLDDVLGVLKACLMKQSFGIAHRPTVASLRMYMENERIVVQPNVNVASRGMSQMTMWSKGYQRITAFLLCATNLLNRGCNED